MRHEEDECSAFFRLLSHNELFNPIAYLFLSRYTVYLLPESVEKAIESFKSFSVYRFLNSELKPSPTMRSIFIEQLRNMHLLLFIEEKPRIFAIPD